MSLTAEHVERRGGFRFNYLDRPLSRTEERVVQYLRTRQRTFAEIVAGASAEVQADPDAVQRVLEQLEEQGLVVRRPPEEVSLADLALATGVTRPALLTAIEHLEGRGMLRRERSTGARGQATRYELLPPAAQVRDRLVR